MNATFSYWEKNELFDNADIIIIGSGIVGLSAALNIKRKNPELNVLVLERGFLPMGASTKNAGFACFGTASEQLSYLNKSTEEEVVKLADYKWRGLQRLRENVGDKEIDFYQHGGYELFLDDEDEKAEKCLNQLDHLNRMMQPVSGSKNTYTVSSNKIKEFGFKKVSQLIYNPFEGQLNTGKMMRALLLRVQNLGVLVLNSCEVIRIEHISNGVDLITSRGIFKTKKIILATNAFADQLFPQLQVTPGRGQVLITKPVPGLKLKGTYHFNDGYYYFRNIDGRVLFGGGRNIDFEAEETYRFGNTDIVKSKLVNCLNEIILPGTEFEVDYWWSGIMGFGDEIKPIVKKLETDVFCAVRCNGMGVAMGSLVGEEVADLLLAEI